MALMMKRIHGIGTTYQKKLTIPITLHICQYLGEDILPYEETGENQ